MSRDRGIFPLHRLEGLSDGIFAISMTLLVLNIPLPGSENPVDSDGQLLNFLMGLGRLYHTYIISFLMLGIFWITQQKLFRNIKSTCTPHLWASLGSLLFVCMIPFSASLIGRFDGFFIANCFFHLNVLAIGIFILLQWATVRRHPEMLKEDAEPGIVLKGIKINLVLPVLALVAIGVAAFSPNWSTAVYAVTPFMISRIRGRTKADPGGPGSGSDNAVKDPPVSRASVSTAGSEPSSGSQ